MINGMYGHFKPILIQNPDYIVLHISPNEPFRNTANELLDKVLAFKNPIISTITMCVHDQQQSSFIKPINCRVESNYFKDLIRFDVNSAV